MPNRESEPDAKQKAPEWLKGYTGVAETGDQVRLRSTGAEEEGAVGSEPATRQEGGPPEDPNARMKAVEKFYPVYGNETITDALQKAGSSEVLGILMNDAELPWDALIAIPSEHHEEIRRLIDKATRAILSPTAGMRRKDVVDEFVATVDRLKRKNDAGAKGVDPSGSAG